MVINKNSLKASYTKNNQTITIYLADYITSANFGYYKHWSEDAGRNLAKSVVGTFDIFPKIIVNFKPLTKAELDIISPLLNSETQSVTYYDPDFKTTKTMSTYTGDWSYDNNNPRTNESFKCSFISRTRRL